MGASVDVRESRRNLADCIDQTERVTVTRHGRAWGCLCRFTTTGRRRSLPSQRPRARREHYWTSWE